MGEEVPELAQGGVGAVLLDKGEERGGEDDGEEEEGEVQGDEAQHGGEEQLRRSP